ncbi:MAG: glutaminase [Pseudomonadota bacterium]
MGQDLLSKMNGVSIDEVLAEIVDHVQPVFGQGKVADYIPALAKVPPERFAMAVHCCQGAHADCGDADVPFSIQSISKVFTLTLVMSSRPEADIWKRVWREPSGTPFNSMIMLERENGIPRNPFINAGALVITDMLISDYGRQGAIDALLNFMRTLCGNSTPTLDEEVARSELATGHKNLGLAHTLKSFGNLENSVDDVMDVYCHQCALSMSVKQLASASVFLAKSGYDTTREVQVVPNEIVRRINALMITCGHYDAAGNFAFRVGLPGKSGVGGGIIAIIPDEASLAVWSPGLDEYGNSLVGTLALETFVEVTGTEIL